MSHRKQLAGDLTRGVLFIDELDTSGIGGMLVLSSACLVHQTGCTVALDRRHERTELGKALMLEPARDATLRGSPWKYSTG